MGAHSSFPLRILHSSGLSSSWPPVWRCHGHAYIYTCARAMRGEPVSNIISQEKYALLNDFLHW
jgi:hypothetical protein